MSIKRPVAEVSVDADAGTVVWPQTCGCCASAADPDSIVVYCRTGFGARRAIQIPYCRRCKSHHGRAAQRALASAAAVLAIGFTILLIVFLFGMLDEIVGFFLQLLVVVGAVIWAGCTYLVARARIQHGMTSACSGAEGGAVIFLNAPPSAWRFRFFSHAFAEQFAEANRGSRLIPL